MDALNTIAPAPVKPAAAAKTPRGYMGDVATDTPRFDAELDKEVAAQTKRTERSDTPLKQVEQREGSGRGVAEDFDKPANDDAKPDTDLPLVTQDVDAHSSDVAAQVGAVPSRGEPAPAEGSPKPSLALADKANVASAEEQSLASPTIKTEGVPSEAVKIDLPQAVADTKTKNTLALKQPDATDVEPALSHAELSPNEAGSSAATLDLKNVNTPIDPVETTHTALLGLGLAPAVQSGLQKAAPKPLAQSTLIVSGLENGEGLKADALSVQPLKDSDTFKGTADGSGDALLLKTSTAPAADGKNDATAHFGSLLNSAADVSGASTTLHEGTHTLSAQPMAASSALQPEAIALRTTPEITIQVPQQRADMAAKHVGFELGKQLKNGESQFTVRMDPPELGKLDVRLTITKAGEVQAHILVERETTLDLLMRDARALERGLAEAGLKPDQNALNFSLRQDQANQNPSAHADGSGSAPIGSSGETIEDDQPIGIAASEMWVDERPLNLVI